MNSAAHNVICTPSGITGEINHIAIPSMTTPKKSRTAFIHGPGLGSKVPADAPMSSNGTPIPMDNAKSAAPPNITSWVLLIYLKAPASGAATHGLIMSCLLYTSDAADEED